MPAPGEQHSRISNPFEDVKPRISEYTAQEIATLQARLERQLGPEYLSARAGPGGQKIHYVAAEKVIGLANEVFGFNGWSSSIQNIQVDFVDEHPQTLKISLGLHVVVRVTLRDGTFHEDIGYGHIENCKGKAMAFEKAKKEGTTDALKRALRNFGNVLGNCVYDKAYLAKVTKLKVESTKFDESNLHRHPDFAKKEAAAEPRLPPVKAEATNDASAPAHPPLPPLPEADSFDDLLLGEFDEADFCVVDAESHPDEVVLPEISQDSGSSGTNRANTMNRGPGAPAANFPHQQRAKQPPSRINPAPGSAGHPQPQTPNHQVKRSGAQNGSMNNNQNNGGSRDAPQGVYQARPQQPPHNHASNSNGTGQHNRPVTNDPSLHTPPQPRNVPPSGAEPVAFFSARAVPRVLDDTAPTPPPATATPAVLFNPKAESPSIRKTPGIDHTSSRPVTKVGQHAPGKLSQEGGELADDKPTGHSGNGVQDQPPHRQQQQQPPQQRGSMLNPQFDQSRRIGAPGGAASPLSNRNQYKPPTMMKRPPLADVPNGTANVSGGPGDAKRVKLG